MYLAERVNAHQTKAENLFSSSLCGPSIASDILIWPFGKSVARTCFTCFKLIWALRRTQKRWSKNTCVAHVVVKWRSLVLGEKKLLNFMRNHNISKHCSVNVFSYMWRRQKQTSPGLILFGLNVVLSCCNPVSVDQEESWCEHSALYALKWCPCFKATSQFSAVQVSQVSLSGLQFVLHFIPLCVRNVQDAG